MTVVERTTELYVEAGRYYFIPYRQAQGRRKEEKPTRGTGRPPELERQRHCPGQTRGTGHRVLAPRHNVGNGKRPHWPATDIACGEQASVSNETNIEA